MPLDWKPFVDLVRAHQRFLLTTHVRPDGDGLGSMLALADVLEAQEERSPSGRQFTAAALRLSRSVKASPSVHFAWRRISRRRSCARFSIPAPGDNSVILGLFYGRFRYLRW